MAETAKKKISFLPQIDLPRFWILFKMLFGNAMGISFKNDKKKAIIKIVSWVVGFAAVAALSFVFFFFSNILRIFSTYYTISPSVPSLICMLLYLLGFIPSAKKIVDRLYWSRDNRILLAFPCNASTIFTSKLAVIGFEEIIKAYMVEVPFLVGYLIFRGAPFYGFAWVFVAWIFLALAKTLILASISIPIQYVSSVFKKHSHITVIVSAILVIFLIIMTAWAISMMPNAINIADIWSEINTAMTGFLRWYRNQFSFLYQLTNFTIGTYMEDGMSYVFFTADSWRMLGISLGTCILFAYIAITFVGPNFIRIASFGTSFASSPRKNQGNLQTHHPIVSQFKKEALLFFADPMVFTATLGSFVILPIFIGLMNKIFGAFATTSFGDGLVNAFNVLLILVISTASNTVLARIYSREGDAFALTRSYPRSQMSLLFSKIFLPTVLGFVSITASCIVYCNLKQMSATSCVGLSLGLLGVYLGHALFSAGLDISTKTEQYSDQDATSPNEVRSVVVGLVIAALMAALFYLYCFDQRAWWSLSVHESASMKLLIIGLLFLSANIVLFRAKVRYIYSKGRSL